MRVSMPRPGSDAFQAALRELLPAGVDLVVGEADEPCEVLVEGRPSDAALDAAPRLERLVIPYAGVPERTLAQLRARPHLVAHNLHHNAAPVAEMALGLLLAAARAIVPGDAALRRGDWRPRYAEDERGLLLAGRSALVVGYGAIGRRIGRALQALDVHVVGVRRHGRGRDGAVTLFGCDALDPLLERADVLVLATPLTEATRGLIDRRRLSLLPRHAVLVNVARGPVVDEGALYAALAEGRLAAAGLDVWWRYPEDEESRVSTPPSVHPFGTLDNVVLSPHRAGHASSTEGLRARHLARILTAILEGDEVPNRVDPAQGY